MLTRAKTFPCDPVCEGQRGPCPRGAWGPAAGGAGWGAGMGTGRGARSLPDQLPALLPQRGTRSWAGRLARAAWPWAWRGPCRSAASWSSAAPASARSTSWRTTATRARAPGTGVPGTFGTLHPKQVNKPLNEPGWRCLCGVGTEVSAGEPGSHRGPSRDPCPALCTGPWIQVQPLLPGRPWVSSPRSRVLGDPHGPWLPRTEQRRALGSLEGLGALAGSTLF